MFLEHRQVAEVHLTSVCESIEDGVQISDELSLSPAAAVEIYT